MPPWQISPLMRLIPQNLYYLYSHNVTNSIVFFSVLLPKSVLSYIIELLENVNVGRHSSQLAGKLFT